MEDSRFHLLGFWKNLSEIFHSKVCWAWVASVMAVQVLISTWGGGARSVGIYSNLGLSREGFLSGEIWQLFTYGWMHAGFWHAGLNALFLLMVGHRIERILGTAAVNRCVLLGILGGACLHLLIGSGLLVGLSGGCFGLLVLLATLSPQSRMFPLPLAGRSLALGFMAASFLLAVIHPSLNLPVLSGIGRFLANHGLASWFDIGHACHFGGGLAGWIYGRWILRPRVTLASLRRDRARREAQ